MKKKKEPVERKCRDNDEIQIPKFCIGLFAAYWLLIVAFYFLAGDQLCLRQSRGELAMPTAEAGTVELIQGAVVEQRFTVKIQRLQTVSVQWGTYYRPNAGAVTMELWNDSTGTLLLSQTYDAAAIQEGGITTLTAEEPLEGLYGTPLVLRLYADSSPGSALSPLMNQTTPTAEGFALTLSDTSIEGTLCFSASGEDYIWTGLHYWQFAAGFGGLLALALFYVYRRWATGRHSYVVYALTAVKKYRFLIRQLVSRDFRTKYKRSVLGIFWSFLNPLLTMLVQYFVFSTIFKSDIPNFAAYLIIGTVMFNFFTEACGMALTSIIGNAGLITKVYMPKYIYPVSRALSSSINLLFSLIPLVGVMLITHVHISKAVVLVPIPLICLFVFSLGIGMILATMMVFFRDTQFLWGVLSTIWMYMTPIFYPESILPAKYLVVFKLNPMYHIIRLMRTMIIDGVSPEPKAYIIALFMSFATLFIGAVIFKKNQDKFVLNI